MTIILFDTFITIVLQSFLQKAVLLDFIKVKVCKE